MKRFLLLILFTMGCLDPNADLKNNGMSFFGVFLAMSQPVSQVGSSKDIAEFTIVSPYAVGIINDTSIAITVPFGTNVTSLIAKFSTTGTSVNVGNVTQVSGITSNDFTNPVTYIVYGNDGTTKNYTVTVTTASVSAKEITIFSFPAQSTTGTITGTNISVTVPYGTNASSLVAAFATTGANVKVGTTLQISGITANDFTSPVIYTVTANDGSTTNYAVSVTVASVSSKEITIFVFPAQSTAGTITGTSISVSVPTGTNVTSLIAAFATTGTSVKVGSTTQVSGLTINNFSSPVTYTVTASDGSTQDYVVTVSVATAPTISSWDNTTRPRITSWDASSFRVSWSGIASATSYNIYYWTTSWVFEQNTTVTSHIFTTNTSNSRKICSVNSNSIEIQCMAIRNLYLTTTYKNLPTKEVSGTFFDDFSDSIIGSSYELVNSTQMTEAGGYLQLNQNVTDNGPQSLILYNRGNNRYVKMTWKQLSHRSNTYFVGGLGIYELTGVTDGFGLMMAYKDDWPCYGLCAQRYTCSDANAYGSCTYSTYNPSSTQLFDTWMDFKVIFDFDAGTMTPTLNGTTYSSMSLRTDWGNRFIIQFASGGWFTGHYVRIDDLSIQSQNTAFP